MQLDKKNSEILLNSNIGFEFEFFSHLDSKKTKTDLEHELGKKIHVEEKSHSDFIPDDKTYKMEPDFSGGATLFELITGPLKYIDGKIILMKMMNWINKNAHTTDRSGIHLNISFNTEKYGKNFLSRLNPLKFILDFDEDYIYQYWPERKNNVYAKSIKYVEPIQKQSFYSSENINSHEFKVPFEKYYGINFEKLQKNYLEFRYLGGKDYHKKVKEINTVWDYFVLSLFNSAKERDFNEINKVELMRILKLHENINKAYLSFEQFKENFPKIGLLINLDTDIRRINLYWGKIQNQIYNILSEGGMEEGLINYDSNTSRIQIKDAKLLNNYKLEGIDIIDSEIKGRLFSCDIFNCNVDNVEIYTCNMFDHSQLFNCRIDNTYVNRSCYLKDCYVCGMNSIMNGTMEGGIFRKGKFTDLAKFINCEIVEYEKINFNPNERH
jgi:hypothetical protein